MNAQPRKQGLYDPSNEKDACGIGAVVHIKGVKSHSIVKDALTALVNLNHRGACGCEPNTGDGAGILFQIPHKFFKKVSGVQLPAEGSYGVGMIYLPRDAKARAEAEKKFESIIKEEGQEVLGWRDVPTDDSSLGATAKAAEPAVRQVFIKMLSGTGPDELKFERKLYLIRKRAEHSIKVPDAGGSNQFYVPSLSTRTIVYKGMLLSPQMEPYYTDLRDPDLESAIASNAFRKDLYYRLNVVSVDMPPLRDHREDIPMLATYFAAKHGKRVKRRLAGLSPEALACLEAYGWPGNVRELENAIERAVVLGTTDLIIPEDLPEAVRGAAAASEVTGGYHQTVREEKKRVIRAALGRSGGNYTEAAKLLAVHPNYLHRLVRNLDLKEEVKKASGD